MGRTVRGEFKSGLDTVDPLGMRASTSSGRSPRWAEIAVGLASVALCVAAAEWTLRLTLPLGDLEAGGPPPAEASQLRYEGSIFSRNVLAPSPLEVKAGPFHYRVNALGYRGPDFAVEKPAGTIRIAVYGGSSAFDIYRGDAESWPARLGRELADRGIAGVEVINAGVAGARLVRPRRAPVRRGAPLLPRLRPALQRLERHKYFGSEESLLRRFGP